jgi:predicted RNA-binding Zn ribbon-like protein
VVPIGQPADEKLLLDLLNSTPVLEGRPHDELEDPHAAEQWMHAHDYPNPDEDPSPAEEVLALLALRPVLQGVVHGAQSPRALAPFLTEVSYWAQAADEGIAWNLEIPSGRSAAVRVVLAWDELRRSSPGRLRACANPECRRFLIDRSKPNNARWCSMATCGNRMKARRHYEKSRSDHHAG